MTPTESVTETTSGEAVRRIRRDFGITLARLSSQAGITHSTLSRFERGERGMAPATYANVVAALATLLAERQAA